MVYVVTIDGIIGCGKSSLIAQLSEDFTCFQEPVHEWSLLQNFYEDMKTYSAPFQYQVLFSYHKLYSTFKNVKDKVILERCPWSSRYIFTEMLVENKFVSQDEYDMYTKFYDKIAFATDLYIYLKVDTDVAYNRILQRDRAAERSLRLDYLQQLNAKYDQQIPLQQNVFVVDANKPLNDVKQQVLHFLQQI
ncbi:thymidine kinase [Chloriridovirus anopheles1]|uniref:Thymidine kinase n=1 Tax=Chloriridovirus anopheles1 TaxID=1465751 RepID=W8QE76_9VIRU|nr:thymidine kinase [Anopheles minimus iridovirus]AHL67605.1 thymidine kinase [Anopheles minimus iridovirus]